MRVAIILSVLDILYISGCSRKKNKEVFKFWEGEIGKNIKN